MWWDEADVRRVGACLADQIVSFHYWELKKSDSKLFYPGNRVPV